MKYLNLGCGSRFHPGWTNIDATSSSPYVQVHDCRKRIPYPDSSFEVVYHSHLLEHFPKQEALRFIRECYRVLMPGGIIRVVVPDLERIARLYLCALDNAAGGDIRWQHDYEWLVLELYDQAVRERPGGEMIEYLKQDPLPNATFVLERCGGEVRRILQAIKNPPELPNVRPSLVTRGVRKLRSVPRLLRSHCLRKILGPDGCHALEIGRFRMAGEVHQWMYDRYSLALLLKQGGFQRPQPCRAPESQIPVWSSYHLDTEPDGSVYKPDSLYMEAVKPQ